jgi:hypothetical protein
MTAGGRKCGGIIALQNAIGCKNISMKSQGIPLVPANSTDFFAKRVRAAHIAPRNKWLQNFFAIDCKSSYSSFAGIRGRRHRPGRSRSGAAGNKTLPGPCNAGTGRT